MSHSSVWTTGPKISPDCWTSSLGKSPKPMFCSSRLGLKMALELRGLPVLFSLIISLPFWDALCCFKNSTQVSCLGNQAWILHWRWKARQWKGLWCRVSTCWDALGIARHLAYRAFERRCAFLSMLFAPLCHVSAQLTTHTSPGPWSTSDSSCLCLSLGPTAHDKIMKLITHIIYGGAPFADGECVNGLQWLINISIFNPVTWMWICKFASPNSNQDRNMHAIPIP